MPRVPASSDGASRLRIIESALSLFASKGVDNVSLRELTAHAGVNLAAVNYHFGSKEGLAQTVYEELAKRVNRRRLDELERIMGAAAAQKARPVLEDVVMSFVRPYLAPDGTEGALLAHLILQHRLSPTDMTAKLMRKHFDPMAKKYIAALAAACPEVETAEFYWRYMFMVSTVVLTMTDRSKGNRLVKLSAGSADPADAVALGEALVRYLCGAMRAPG
ncbi:TetR/AcrR family transcriptional regulator [Verticiella sediminum]|uniref:TetR/AcrR family transcriptional regulator n=1 Tax=Verticiella sediminum TaxID=1247510 RepID=A0A556AGM7_9BURK|nr:TetR family transcriptional regulator [Verticiella sediminum]TSH92044.1 TetR/AcrR family transcriptional regulator [Verticiella sediminum]